MPNTWVVERWKASSVYCGPGFWCAASLDKELILEAVGAALDLIVRHRISGLPVLDMEDRVVTCRPLTETAAHEPVSPIHQ